MNKKTRKKMNRIFLIFVVFSFLGCSFIQTSNSQSTVIKEERFQGKVKIGMTKDEVRENWGTPDKIINKQGQDFDEIWIYIPNWKFKNYLYFKNGVLIKGDPNPEDLI